MHYNINRYFIACITLMLLFGFNAAHAQATLKSDVICGKWMITDKNLIVQIYKDGDQFKAKIVWFNDADDKSRPMETRLDTENPDVKMRTQKILGTGILQKLKYKPDSDSWEGGIIYDALHGRYWDSAAYINPKGELKVTGYWHFKFIGKTLTFTRVDQPRQSDRHE